MTNRKLIGYACTYTPTVLISAAGYTPYRLLPDAACPDKAGQILHDNLCPHVKMILNRVMNDAVPGLEGLILMNSCDAMRRLADAWRFVDKNIPVVLLDLPVVTNDISVSLFRSELVKLADLLARWAGISLSENMIKESIASHNQIAAYFEELRLRVRNGKLKGGAVSLQKAYNFASVNSPEDTIEYLKDLTEASPEENSPQGVPVFLFGNIMPETDLFVLFEESGLNIVTEDMCTGSRLYREVNIENNGKDIFHELARNILNKKPCARTINEAEPGSMAESIIREVRANNVQGVIGYTAKFCDPYIARLPLIMESLKKEGVPFLLIEGDCTLRSISQQRNRIEAFMEMMR